MKIAMITYSFYERDNRVLRYAETLAARGDRVDVVALRQEGQPAIEVVNGVRVSRIQKRVVDEKGKLSYLVRTLLFLVKSMVFLTLRQIKYRYDVIHIHSVPDFLVFAALVPKLMRTKVILDIHDLLPELYASKFRTNDDSLGCKSLLLVERTSTWFADHVICANHLWYERLISRSACYGKCTVLLNYPDRRIFARRGRDRDDGRFVILYPGSLNWHQGVDIAIRAFALIKDDAPNAEFHIYGVGPEKDPLANLTHMLGLEDRVFIKRSVPLREIATVMENADLGVVPKRTNSFANEAFSTKILEFMAMGVPVIVTDSRVDRYYFNESVVSFFRNDNEKDLARCMLRLIKNPEIREQLVVSASEFITQYEWEVAKGEYLRLVDSLARNGRSH